MRSRYCAYALGNLDWIRETWASETLPSDLEDGDSLQWFSLDVRNASMQDESHGTVEFVARAKVPGGRAIRMHALSRFEKRDGKWVYVDDDPSVS